ncbi:hypothetical protein CRX67_09510 [Enterobacteriaceae bacterium A-F18]|nr:hypothetical protein CRX67_09510 [Enterobacteriaceae bacterium A-F18]HEO9916651.1 hypothetical protein [Enterobacter asburiae]
MAKESELQRASLSGYKLFALLKVAAFAADELEESEVKALFELAYDLSVPVSIFLQLIEEETVKNGK